MTHRLNVWLLGLFIVIGVPFYWYLIDPGPDSTQTKPVTIEQLRNLAGAIEGRLPAAVHAELIGHRWTIRDMLVAGWGLRPVPAAVRSYELVVPDEKPIVINAGTTRAVARDHDIQDFSRSAQARVNAALTAASHVVILHDDPLKNGGIVPKTRAAAHEAKHLHAAPRPLAPGVVVIPVPGIGPGAKMVYVQLANGREFLFTGPAAKVRQSLYSLHPPARLAANDDLSDPVGESKAWLMTINALRRAAPDMTIITGSDSARSHHVLPRFSDYFAPD